MTGVKQDLFLAAASIGAVEVANVVQNVPLESWIQIIIGVATTVKMIADIFKKNKNKDK